MSFEVSGPAVERADVVLTGDALVVRPPAPRPTRSPSRRAARAARGEASRGGPDRTPRLPARDGRNPFWQLAGRAGTARPGRPAGRDHRADRAQDDDQRAELRSQGVAGRSRGRQHPALGQRRRRPGQPVRRRARHRVVHQPRRPRVPPARRTSRSATIVVRPRGWHLDERHITFDDRIAVGALVDFGLHFFHNAKALLDQGSGPYFYLPKMESHLEARLWNDVFVHGAGGARHPGRHDPGHGAHRDHPGGVRDGGDPLRAARPRVRAQRRPLGLPLQHHQVLPRCRARTSCCRTAARSP